MTEKEIKMICNLCKAEDDHSKYHESYVTNIMRFKGVCFTCGVWLSYTDRKDIIVIDGSTYVDSRRRSNIPQHMLGFDGREFYIQRGREIIHTNNLNFKGKVPEHFLDKFPNNAVFVTRKEVKTLQLLKAVDNGPRILHHHSVQS